MGAPTVTEANTHYIDGTVGLVAAALVLHDDLSKVIDIVASKDERGSVTAKLDSLGVKLDNLGLKLNEVLSKLKKLSASQTRAIRAQDEPMADQ